MDARRSGILLLAAIFTGCSPAATPTAAPAPDSGAREKLDQEFRERVEAFNRQTGARQIAVGEAQAKLARGEKVVFLDVREREENAVSALGGARHLPPATVDSADLALPADATVITYCTVGYRSGLAAVELERRLGRPVLNLTGGIIAWFNAGGEVRDPGGRPADRIHPFDDEWARYVHPRAPTGATAR
jgi:rhodanese-related sulfurtransferase